MQDNGALRLWVLADQYRTPGWRSMAGDEAQAGQLHPHPDRTPTTLLLMRLLSVLMNASPLMHCWLPPEEP